PVGGFAQEPAYASSTSIFFASAASFTILKLRICPSARGSCASDAAGALPFQRAFNIEESCERSGLLADGVVSGDAVAAGALPARPVPAGAPAVRQAPRMP